MNFAYKFEFAVNPKYWIRFLEILISEALKCRRTITEIKVQSFGLLTQNKKIYSL